ncbi:MAG: hypothetical protein KF774_10600 [Planctomyces sp.]|nr:hypothetical protein [Planctomyces sp.]
MLASLWLPMALSAVAVFVLSFLSWMVVGLHAHDWRKLANEDGLLSALSSLGITPGNYMFPGADSPAEMNSEAYRQKWDVGPRGVMTVYGSVHMGRNLGLTFLYFLAVSFCLAYLATLALPAGAGFLPVFRFVSTAAFLIYAGAIVQHAIWFHCRVVGHVLESLAYAATTGAIFGLLWPSA